MYQRLVTIGGLSVVLLAVLIIPLSSRSGLFGLQSVSAQSCPPSVAVGCIVAGPFNGTVWTAHNTGNNSSPSRGLEGRTDSTQGVGVRGVAYSVGGTTTGLQGEVYAPNGRGIRGVAYVDSSGFAGTGILGITQGAGVDAAGVTGVAQSTAANSAGVRAITNGQAGRALLATALDTTGTSQTVSAVEARVAGRDDIAVKADATSSSGFSKAIQASLYSPTGYVIDAYALQIGPSASAIAVKAQADGDNGTAVYGRAVGAPNSGSAFGGWFQADGYYGTGVVGTVTGTGGVGIKGFAPATGGRAAEFSGRVDVYGDFNVIGATKDFMMDHPLDPANMYLKHAAIESNEVLNVYSGNVTTDDDGSAIVILPKYFEAINRDFRYQLTVVGQFAQAIVSSEIKDNQFRIATDKPQVKVSWQVSAVRNDPYMQANPYQAEVPKPDTEQGTYLMPELYGQPEELRKDPARPQLDVPLSEREPLEELPPTPRDFMGPPPKE